MIDGDKRPVALDRLTDDRAAPAVTYRSDKSEGPTTGTETVDPLASLARVLVRIPDNRAPEVLVGDLRVGDERGAWNVAHRVEATG